MPQVRLEATNHHRVELTRPHWDAAREALRIKDFKQTGISELINPSANGADRNELALMVSYARLGANKAPTDIPPDGFEKCVSQLRGSYQLDRARQIVEGYVHHTRNEIRKRPQRCRGNSPPATPSTLLTSPTPIPMDGLRSIHREGPGRAVPH
jgi:hypothetical protein